MTNKTNKTTAGNTENKGQPTNVRADKRATERRYVWLVVGMLVLGGSVVIGLVYGGLAVLTAVPFLLGGALLLLGTYFLLTRLEKWLERRA